MNTDELTTIAVNYQRSGEGLSTLFDRLKPAIYKQARKWSNLSNIDIDDLTSLLYEQVWRSAEEYNPEKDIDFLYFYRMRASNAIRDLCRKMGTRKRAFDSKLESLDGLTEIGFTFSDKNSLEDEVITNLIYNEFLSKSDIDRSLLKVIIENDNNSIARFFGSDRYNERIRKRVSRIKSQFKEYLFA